MECPANSPPAREFEEFLKGLRGNLNESITSDEAIEMLAQHLITRPIFEALFSVTWTDAPHIPVICVDGPTTSGKGTLASEVARRLGYHYLDSGALYRITGLAATQAGLSLDVEHEHTIARMAETLPIVFTRGRVLLDGEDVTDAIRTEEAGMNASRVSALPAVRTALVALQQSFRKLPGLVADGRDMGTVIFPDAPLKVYLTASAGQRAVSLEQLLEGCHHVFRIGSRRWFVVMRRRDRAHVTE